MAPVAGSVSINDVTITEGNSGTQLLQPSRSRAAAAPRRSTSTTPPPTAPPTVADNDYVNVPRTVLHFNAGDTTKTVSVTINGDTKVEGNESFNVNLTGATNGATISKGVGIGTIINDDVAPVAGSVSINDAQIAEGNSGTQLLNFTVTRTGGTAAFDVNYATSDGTATVADNDYVDVPTTRSHFNAGDTTKTISVTINGDTKVEANETFNVNLSGATNGATISKGVGVGIITNDDAAPVAGSVSIDDAQIVEGNNGTQLPNFTVTRSGGAAAFDVNYGTRTAPRRSPTTTTSTCPPPRSALQRRRHHEDDLGHDQRRHQGGGERELQRQPDRRDQWRDHQRRRGRRHHHQR